MTEDPGALADALEGAQELSTTAAAALRSIVAAQGGTTPATWTTDAALAFAATVVPGWAIHLRGVAAHPDGQWHCTLRASDTRDDMAFVAQAAGPVAAHVIFAAALRALAYRRTHAL